MPDAQPHQLFEFLAAYTDQVLAFNLAGPKPPALKPVSDAERAAFIARTARLAAGSGAQSLVLVGLGSGEIAAQLKAALPHTEFLICEPSPQRARDALAQGQFLNASQAPLAPLLADASPRALWLLARGILAGKKFITCLNPELPEAETAPGRTLQRLLEFHPQEAPAKAQQDPPELPGQTLSLYAIVHPEEPDLAEFLARLPPWLAEVVLLWDAAAPPDAARVLGDACPAPVRHAARPLAGDFAAQRNYALSLCASAWIISLDADERLSPQAWEALRAEITAPRARAYLLPRLTLYPDDRHFRMGYGLWPDPQLRLFARDAAASYINPVHEILTGFAGNPALLPHCSIIHLSYVLKDRATLAERLAVFDQALGRETHRLNETFPHLPLTWHEAWLRHIHDLDFLPLLLKV